MGQWIAYDIVFFLGNAEADSFQFSTTIKQARDAYKMHVELLQKFHPRTQICPRIAMLVSDPHLVLLPSGIGNLTPFLHLAFMMASSNCKVTFIKILPQASDPELTSLSIFCTNHPQITVLDFEIDTHTPSDSCINDSFILHIVTINRSLHRLDSILSSSQVSAICSDFAISATLSQISANLGIPFYIVSTTSAKNFSVIANLPALLAKDPNVFSIPSGEIEIQGLSPIPKSSIPPAWTHNSSTNYLLTAYLLPNARSLSKAKGVLLNTFSWFEKETIAALHSGIFSNILPAVFPIGPLQSHEPHKFHNLPWLSEQPAQSVLYINFGSREVISLDHIKELEKGLEICGCNYLWVIKDNKEDDSNPEGTLKGKIIRGGNGIDQEKILGDPAIGGFVNNCEWDSVMQAAWHGVPMLAWPQHGDQKMIAEIVEKSGLGIWIKEESVKREEIGRLVAQIMGDLNMKKAAKMVREKAREACEIGGSTENAFKEVIGMFTSNKC